MFPRRGQPCLALRDDIVSTIEALSISSAVPVGSSTSAHAPIVSSYNDRIRPLLDAVDSLRH
ncbi:UNVERIFIED_CONTAM: hypothetical protein Sangu_3217100 [Sesamum angustifolium]|uniref:Uncharacterized protein n=1 Tax=Sesamum angustifolium TaxID=2727405 RepID=A0AAW2JJM5_9LAMI